MILWLFNGLCMYCHFGIIEGHVVQLKEICSQIEGADSSIGPLWPQKINALFVALLQCRSNKPKEYPHVPLYARWLIASSFNVA